MLDYVESDFEEATPHLTRAYQLDPTFPTPLLFASISLSNQHRAQEADSIAHILARNRARLTPFYQDWLDYRLAFLAGRRPQALSAVRRLAARAPGTKAVYNLAVEALENGYIDEAIRALESLPPDRGSMRGWAAYWELLGAAHHLEGDYTAELRAGDEARSRYPRRLFALLPSVRALAAMGRDEDLGKLLDQSATLGRDPAGTTVATLLHEAGDEALAHGRPAAARAYFERSLRWYQDRLRAGAATHADTMETANLLYALGRWKEAAPLVGPSPESVDQIGLAGLLAARQGRVDEARALASRLAADRRPYQFGEAPVEEARITALLGDTATALAALRNAFQAGRHYDLWIHRTPEFAILRSSPEFQELTRPKR